MDNNSEKKDSGFTVKTGDKKLAFGSPSFFDVMIDKGFYF